ncbi:MAG TPA: aldose epimerase family protein [Solirubrobacteraceae bacterium]|jgi:aldose 1-epimerase|nr:aldose epimerase family protein [Solirubrobacteraceae bacterium]
MLHVSTAIRRRLVLPIGFAGIAAVSLTFGSAALAAAPHARAAHHRRTGSHRAVHAHRARPHRHSRAGVTSAGWGSVGGQQVNLYTLTNGNGMKVNISNYGGVVQSIWVPTKSGKLIDVSLGFPKLSDYVDDFTQGATSTAWPEAGGSGDTYFGGIIGRYANRIANASFTLNGTTYKLDANNGPNTLHGGYLGWNTKVWTASTSTKPPGTSLTLTADFPAGEGCLPSLSPGCTGFPAAVSAKVTYTLTARNQLQISYAATNQSSTDPTVVNLTNHTYFNLGGEASGSVYNQLLALNSDAYTPTNVNQIPEAPYFVPVGGTAYDFRTMHPIGEYLTDANLPDGTSGPLTQLQIAHGYDNNWVLNGQGSYRLAAVAQDASNGVTMWTYTDQPGVQLYTGNFLVGDLAGTSGHIYRQGAGFTLETQHYPDSPNHIGQAGWPSVVLNPGATFTTKTAYQFGTEPAGFASRIRFH